MQRVIFEVNLFVSNFAGTLREDLLGFLVHEFVSLHLHALYIIVEEIQSYVVMYMQLCQK